MQIVFAALAVSHWLEHQNSWSITEFVWTAHRYCTIQIKAGRQTLTAADPLPDDLRDVLTTINSHDVHITWPKSGLRFMRCPLCWFCSPGMEVQLE
jgi:hypothetical protein